MAAWRRTGRIEQHKERLVTRMGKKGIATEFAERVFKQICGFGEYGFPESHAASFALVSYAGAWLKRHYPVEFACALLNAQPMGFYSPATIVEDAKRHGVVVLPIDVLASGWDCTLEPIENGFAMRMGLRYVKGLGVREREKIESAVQRARCASLDEFVHETGLDEGSLCALAEAGALESFGIARRPALWEVSGLVREPAGQIGSDEGSTPEFDPMSSLDTIQWDYRRTSHSTLGHPLAPLRTWLRSRGLPDARTLATLPHGERAAFAGLVICRQRPGTASGVVFMTLEDETGFVNVVVWSRVFEDHAILAKTQSFLGVSGTLQVQDGVVHLVAETLWAPDAPVEPASSGSRDFH